MFVSVRALVGQYKLTAYDASYLSRAGCGHQLGPAMPAAPDSHLDAYIEAAGLRGDCQGPLFRSGDRQDRCPVQEELRI